VFQNLISELPVTGYSGVL